MGWAEQDLDLVRARGESLTVEFKSDQRPLSDRDLVELVVAMANTEGGDVYLGIEDDGTVTGLHPNHRDTLGLISLIAGKTNPPITVRVVMVEYEGLPVARIKVPKSRQLVSTSGGTLLRRRQLADGTAGSVPFYPHEFTERLSALGAADPSAEPLASLTTECFDPLERQRLREAIRFYRGDANLLPLADNELDGALGLTAISNGVTRPTLAGLLFLGRPEVLREALPSHEVAFQVLEGTVVRVNEFMRKSLLQTFEDVERRFAARVTEEEVEVGLFRVPVPNYESRAFREAFVNALVHRDYTRLGTVFVRLDDDGLTISNPGGFVDGVTLDNLLVTGPRPRNPRLADIVKRIGLAERTGRGIDRVFEGLLRYGRPAPDYGQSDPVSVVVRMSNAASDTGFLELVLREEERTAQPMPLDSLIILSRLREGRRLKTAELVSATQRSEHETRGAIEGLVEAGLVEAHGTGRGRTYTLSAGVYRRMGERAGYVRQAGFDAIQREQMILGYIDRHGSIRRSEAAELCRLNENQAYHLLRGMRDKGLVQLQGRFKKAFYTRKR